MEFIELPDLEDDEDNFPLPSFTKPAFGSTGSTSSLPESGAQGTPDYPSHRSNPSSDNLSRPSLSTPSRPGLKGSASYSIGIATPGSHGHDDSIHSHRLGKFSNGSNTSLVTAGTSIGSTPGFLQSRKGSKASLTSIRNAFKSSAAPVPPVPNLNATAYPALRNPFSRFDSPASPSTSGFNSPRHNALRKQSTASAVSMGGRSATSQGSSSFRADDQAIPALPPIPSRATPSRSGRRGSDAPSLFAMSRRNGSVGGLEGIEEGMARTAGEEAMRAIWRDFREAADGKVSRICARPLNTQPAIPAYLDAGVDSSFDTLVTSLAHCARRHARRIADLLNGWCKAHCEGIGASEVRAHLDRALGLQMRVEDAAAILGGRKSSTARYILNRTLIELVKLTPKENVGEDLGMLLEQNAFNAYRSEKIEETMQVPHRKAASDLQIELLGQLSKTRFLTVSDRFTRELGRYASAQPTRETEARIEHLLKGMRHLKLRVYPENELEMSSEFIQSLAMFFANSHGQALKSAYAETFTSLLHPVIETATAEVNHPMWSKATAIVLSRALAMASKPRYWATAFPLVVVSLGVSPREVIMQHWQPCIDAITARLKDRSTRVIAMNSFIRLLWIYLNRCSESSTSTRKRLDVLLRTHFPPSGQLHPPDFPLEPFIIILHYVMVRQLDYGEVFIGDYLRENQEGPAYADRATVLVRAIGYTLLTGEAERAAHWPKSADFTQFTLDGFETSGDILADEVMGRSEVSDFMRKCNPAVYNKLFSCDRLISHMLLSNDAVSLAGHASSSSMEGLENITRKHGDVYVSYAAKYEPIFRLHTAILEILPRALAPDAGFSPIANILCRGSFSADPKICAAASDAMRRFAENHEHCFLLANTYLQFVFETRHIFRDTFVGARLLESQFERVIQLWLDILRRLVTHQRMAAAQGEEQPDQNVTATLVDKIEGCALFLLCSSSVALRRLASQILVAARDLEGQQRRPSAAFRYSRIIPDQSTATRVVQLYEGAPEDADVAAMRGLPWCTSSDRHRLDLAIAKDKVKLLQRIAESDHPKDGLLWLALVPYLVGRVAEQLPAPAQDLRNIVVSTVLRLQGHVASIASVSASRATPGMRMPPASLRTTADTGVLADHWRLYLAVLCVTMPTQTTVPATPPVQRTKEAVILTPDTIGSPALFHYLSSLMMWEDPRFRDAAVYALGSTGQGLLRPLSEIMLSVLRRLADGGKMGNARETTRRTTANGPLWTSLAHVFRLISPLLLDAKTSSGLANLSSMIGFVKLTYTFLSDRVVKEDFDLQSLRRSFCVVVENLTNALGKLDSSERFLGEEVRGAIFKLCFEWCHVGRRPDVAKARESQTLQAASEGYRGERDRAQYLDDLHAKTKLLSAAAAEAMAGLCQGKLISSVDATPATQNSDHIVEPLTVLRWIRGMFTSSSEGHHETGRKALFALLKYNWECSRLLDEVLHQSFGEGEQFSLDSSFFGVVADLMSEGSVELPVQQVACLALSKLGHPVPDVRLRAFQLTQSLDSTPDKGSMELLPAIGSSAGVIYKQAQKEMSARLAEVYGDHALDFLNECTSRLSQLEAPRRQATLSILPPWLAILDLAPDATDLTAEEVASEHRALSNLMYLAIRFSDDHLDDIRDVFLSFAGRSHSGNTTSLVKFLFEQGGKRKSPDFVLHAQRIMACLAQSDSGDIIFDEICSFIEPAAMASLPDADIPPSPFGSLADLDALMSAPSARSQAFSTGQLALLFAGELLPYRIGDVELSRRLPTLLHVALIHADHAGAALREHCQTVLFQVLRAWICDTTNVPESSDAMAIWQAAENKLSTLARAKHSAFWKLDEDGGAEAAFLAPPKMTTLAMKIIGMMLPLQPRIRQVWGELALSWATSCPIRHLACRSFQVFRVLSPKVSPRMVSDVLARLSSTIASASPEIQAFNLEVIRTFAAITQNLSMAEVQHYPQIFWCALACLTTPYEEEFTEAIELLSHVLDKTNLSDPAVIAHLLSFRPVDWVGPSPHLQKLLLVGLRSSKTDMMAFDLLRRLASCHQTDLIDPASDRLLHGFAAALPWMLHSTDLGEPNEELGMMALDLAVIAEAAENPSFARLLTSFAHNRFRAKDDFIRQAASLLRDYMATHALDLLSTLLGFVLNSNDWMREKSMQMLKLVLAAPEARTQVQAHGTELLQPLLRLVSTNLSAQALDVLDLPMVTDGPLTGEIFGPISSSGWSVPNAKEASSLTRENVTAVFNTCAQETRAASAHFSVVQFADITRFNNLSQLSLDIPSPPTSAMRLPGPPMGMDNASMGDLVGALHSLNQFFDDGLDGTGDVEGSPEESTKESDSHGASLGQHGRMPSETLSERRVRAIMARGRNPSVSSPVYDSHPRSRRHKHTPSEITSSSISSMNDLDSSNNATITPQPAGGIFLNGHGHGHERVQSNGSNGVNPPRQRWLHRPAASYSSINTDGYIEEKSGENLFGLEEENEPAIEANMSSLSISTSMTSTSTSYTNGTSGTSGTGGTSGTSGTSGTNGTNVSETSQSTPVISRRQPQGGLTPASGSRIGYIRNGHDGRASPSPRDY